MESMARLRASLTSTKLFRRYFSQVSSPASVSGGSPPVESVVYRQSMLRPPETARASQVRRNSCSFIGTVIRPMKEYAGKNPRGRVYTVLSVNRSSRAAEASPFTILLEMKDRLAEISLQHLKRDDYIYIKGPLGTYKMPDGGGEHEIRFKVFVEDLNYVTRIGEISQSPASSMEEEIAGHMSGSLDQQGATVSPSVLDHEQTYRDRLRLWQVFFASPFEWWDNRQRKNNPRNADFKHKDTGERLWLSPKDDPPWVRKQLEMLDSKMAAGHRRDISVFSSHKWKLEDFE